MGGAAARHAAFCAFQSRWKNGLTGAVIRDIRRLGKYLLMPLSSGETLLAHLGMTGHFRIEPERPEPLRKHDHLLFGLKDRGVLIYNDARRFGMILLLAKGEEKTHPLLTGMGEDPLSPRF